jgi:hypothetical protein
MDSCNPFKAEAMIMKLDLWSEHLKKAVFESFKSLSYFLIASDKDLSQEIRTLIIQHLKSLKNSFRDYFPLPGFKNK